VGYFEGKENNEWLTMQDMAKFFFLISKIPLLDTPGLVFVCRQVAKICPQQKKKRH
jgi:hypothetical protein